jgi:hypothetical protein
MSNDAATTFVILWMIGYFLPILIAVLRRHRQALAISILTLVAGWTVVGWIVALVWACTQPTYRERWR